MKQILVVAFLLSVTTAALSQCPMYQRAFARKPLMDAIQAGNKTAVLEILSKPNHVDINHRELWIGQTFLIEAIRANQPEIVEILLTHGADPNLREIIGLGDHEERLLGNTPLAAALKKDSIEIVRILMKHGVKLDENPYALHWTKSIDMVRFLLDNGADIDGLQNGAPYLLTAAFQRDLQDVARLLIERGANVKFVASDGDTALLRVRTVEVARLLVEKGADVNAADDQGNTPLLLAHDIEIAKLLIAHGADVNARNKDHYSTLDLLIADGFDYEYALLLVAHGAWIDEAWVRHYGLVKEFEKIKRAVQGTPDLDEGVKNNPQITQITQNRKQTAGSRKQQAEPQTSDV